MHQGVKTTEKQKTNTGLNVNVVCSNTEAAERGCGLPGVTEVTGNPNVTSGEPPVCLKTHQGSKFGHSAAILLL